MEKKFEELLTEELVAEPVSAKPTFTSRLVDRAQAAADRPVAAWILFLTSFAEASFFLVPPDVVLVGLVLAKRERWQFYTLITLAGSVLGGLLGYFIGWALFESIGQTIVDFYQLQSGLETVGGWFGQNAFVAIFLAAFTPIPYKVFTIAAGLFSINLAAFIIASIIGRGARFLLVGYLTYRFGIIFAGRRYHLVHFLTLLIGLIVVLFAVILFLL